MWESLKGDKQGVRFRRQYAVGPYTIDFYCPAKKVAVEVDGEQHFASLEQDKERDAYLAGLGITVIRIPSLDLFEETGRTTSAWLKIIRQACGVDHLPF